MLMNLNKKSWSEGLKTDNFKDHGKVPPQPYASIPPSDVEFHVPRARSFSFSLSLFLSLSLSFSLCFSFTLSLSRSLKIYLKKGFRTPMARGRSTKSSR